MRFQTAAKRAAVLLAVLCFCLTAAGAVEIVPDGQPIERALASLSQEPVAMMELSNITVNTSASGCYVSNVAWYDSDWNPAYNGTFGTNLYHVEIQLTAMAGYYFPETVQGYINNSQVALSRDPSGAIVTLSNDYAPAIWAPTVNFPPKSTTVEAGQWADFWVSGSYTASYEWYLLSPTGEKLALADIQSKFPGVPVPENYNDTLIINQVPPEMNGWKVVCTFISAGGISRKDSSPATITVKGAEAAPSPSPSPSPTPSPSPSPTPEASASPSPTPSAEPEEHVHSFSSAWYSDGESHWHQCRCGEKADQAPHDFQWTKTGALGRRQEEGVCQICGYTTDRAPDSGGESGDSGVDMSSFRVIFYAAAVLLAAGIVILIVHSLMDRKQGRHSRKRRR